MSLSVQSSVNYQYCCCLLFCYQEDEAEDKFEGEEENEVRRVGGRKRAALEQARGQTQSNLKYLQLRSALLLILSLASPSPIPPFKAEMWSPLHPLCFVAKIWRESHGVEIAQSVEHCINIRRVACSIPGRSGRRVSFSRVNFLCWL